MFFICSGPGGDERARRLNLKWLAIDDGARVNVRKFCIDLPKDEFDLLCRFCDSYLRLRKNRGFMMQFGSLPLMLHFAFGSQPTSSDAISVGRIVAVVNQVSPLSVFDDNLRWHDWSQRRFNLEPLLFDERALAIIFEFYWALSSEGRLDLASFLENYVRLRNDCRFTMRFGALRQDLDSAIVKQPANLDVTRAGTAALPTVDQILGAVNEIRLWA